MARGNAVALFGNKTLVLVTLSILLSSTNSTSLAKWLLGLAKKEFKSLNSNRRKNQTACQVVMRTPTALNTSY